MKDINPRWLATVFYRSSSGLVPVDHDVEELHDLHDLVERGPDWNTIEKIEIRLSRVRYPDDTIEQAAQR
jgi:hypothetical protein